MTRPYRLGKRAVTKAATRQRIIDAARELIVEGGARDTSLDAVARRADSTRTTVYDQFGSREELLLAVLNDALDRADVQRVRRALQHRDTATAMRLVVRAACHFWAGEYVLFGRVKALSEIDPAVAEVTAAKEDVRHGHLTNLVHRLAEQGCLRPTCSQRKALATLLLLMSFETFDVLYGRCQMSVESVAATLVDTAERTLLA